ncbi:DUF2306 domain-containing protein [Actinophytocola sp.]|uniref:DUF2306 domain-containing protein n=1 Tax=Actinophytocola sp. TaxID=1872138 RepID=UPI002D7F8B0B|nr:DUF2306 domain-containing protein [Actinophytocola sp.]HET9140875.1 DUF2306 domain-containing protein [Actinophytocola sp.]
MTSRQWVPAALVLLSLLPVVVGAARVSSMVGGAPEMADDARMQTMPVPVLLHIVCASLFLVLGAFQFGARGRRHRVAGRLLVPLGLAGALSALWLTVFLEHPPGDGVLLAAFRLAAGSGWAAALVIAFAAIRRREVTRHRAWMIRGYALAQGGGTQALVFLPLGAISGELPGGTTRALLLGACWAVNLGVAELIIRNQGGKRHESDHAGPVRTAGRVAADRG